ncbi:MAG: glucose-6-phosphate dehydrogenase, partial [Dehalococcoidia bacterium]
AFSEHLHYVRGDLAEDATFEALRAKLEQCEGLSDVTNRLFYLSIAPAFHQKAIGNLQRFGLTTEDTGWRRLVVEKPFGRDEESAKQLNAMLHEVFDERQVFRIDHYLGKETVQNLLVFRFANAIFEPIWNRNYIDNVQITVAETVPVGSRAGYYDASGVVRDMVQNHLLQLLCMVALEPPSSMDADSLRDKKVEVLEAVRRWSREEFPKHAVGAQYEGYLSEEGVANDSRTPTYAAMRLYVDNWRWQGVPFYLRSGKAMADKVSEIVIQFKLPPLSMFHQGPGDLVTANALSVCIQPDEGFHLRFETKVPDQEMKTKPVDMDFHYEDEFTQALPGAYERLLEDAIEGDASLFIRGDQIEQAWNIVDPLLQCWADSTLGAVHSYDVGSWGPEAATALLAQDGYAWLNLCGQHP